MSIFTCCEREDETKYLHPCGCPSASVGCESEMIQAEVGLFSDEDDTTLPTIYYKTKTITFACSGEDGEKRTNKWIPPAVTSVGQCPDANSFLSNLNGTTICSAFTFPSCGGNEEKIYNYLDPDSEADALARTTPTTGTNCSSLWQTRSTGRQFTKRTSAYTIECSGLIVGLEYEVHPSIEKRTAVIGSEGAWEDVDVTPVIFTATSDTKSFAAVALDHVQGYEYKITGANIEKTA